MPRDTNGTYTPPSNNASPAVALTPIRSADFNALMSDMQSALNTNPPTQAQTSTDNAAVRFNGTAGGTQNSGLIIDDNTNVSGAKTIALSGSASGATTVVPAAVASGTLTLPAATDTLVGKATTDTLTNKTFDTAGTGNSFLINGVAATANTGTGAVVRATSPTLTTPNIGAATAATINGATVPSVSDTLVGRNTTDTLTNKTVDTANNTFKLNGASFGTAAQATAALNSVVGDSGSGGTKGLVPAPAAGDAAAGKFLKADGTFAVPPITALANPSATIGLTASNGSATTAMRSDAAPALSQSIAPTWTGKHTWSNGGLQTSGAPPLTVTENWFGAGVQAKVWLDSVFATSDATKPSVGTHLTVDHTVGSGSPYTVFGMGDFRAIVGRSTGGNIYGQNVVMMADTGFNKLLHGVEYDLDNYSGSNAGGVGTTNAQYAVVVAGGTAGTNKATAGMWITGTSTSVYNVDYGIAFGDASNWAVATADLFDNDSKSTALFNATGAHQYGLQWHGATFSTAWATIPNNAPLMALNAAGNSIHRIINYNSGNVILLGDASLTAGINVNASIAPNADNAYLCGVSTARWQAVYAVNGTIQTSDPTLKTDISNLPNMLDTVRAIDPKTFRWIDGGGAWEDAEEEQEVQATELVEAPFERVELRDGKHVLIKGIESVERPVFDEMPVFNEDGTPAMTVVPGRPAVVDQGSGAIVAPAVPQREVPRVRSVPRMVRKMVPVRRPCARPGRRTHWGFLAPDVKAAFDKLGMDFGGYVKTEEGTEALRPDQLIPVLWKSVQELAAEVEKLKAQIPQAA